MSDEKMTVEQALADLNKLADMLFHSGHTDHANNAAAIHKTLTAALADLKAEREELRADAALGRAYRRWYESAKGFCEVNIDVANNFITKDAAREGVSREE